jgi:hypothetical protein
MNFCFCRSATLISVVTNLIFARTDLEAQRLWITTALQILELYTRRVDVCIVHLFYCLLLIIHGFQLEHVKDIQRSSGRIHAFALAEIAFIISLTSADSGVSQAAAKGLRVLAQTDRRAMSPSSPTGVLVDQETRNSIFEQLGDPNVMVVGMCHGIYYS